jgi:RNA polymerase sigma-B factor
MMSSTVLPRPGKRIDPAPKAPPRESRPPDPAAEERLLRQWEPLVRRLVSGLGTASLRAAGAEREDLEQVARIALWQAARRFDPSRGHRFSTFVFPTVRGALLQHLRDRVGTIRLPRHWWELRPRLQRQAEAAAQTLGREPTAAELADQLGLPEEEVAGALGARDLCHPMSLDEPRETPGGEEAEPLAALIGDRDPRLEAAELRVTVRQAVAQLPATLRAVIEQRYFSGMSQKAVGRRLGISQMHVSRLERWALERLREALADARKD